MSEGMCIHPTMAGGLGKKRPDLHYDDVKEWPAAKIRIYFHLPKRPMTKTTMLTLIRANCQPALGGVEVENEPLPDALPNLSIHKLRKLAGFDRLIKGLSKSDYIRIIREGK